jgi:hypothetical protein
VLSNQVGDAWEKLEEWGNDEVEETDDLDSDAVQPTKNFECTSQRS